MSDASRPVACPHCSTRYLLPDSLLGSAGARVKCPNCMQAFLVSPSGAASPLPEATTESAPPPATQQVPAPVDDAVAVAFELVEAFASGREEEIAQAGRDGRFFAVYGAEIIAVFDDYKKRMGRDASPAPFRQLLMERWGVDLTPPPDPGN